MTGSATGSGAAGRIDRPAQRLRASTDVRAVFAARRAASSPVAVVHVKDRADQGAPRVTVVAGKAVGNAVQRNRVKRRIRAGLPPLRAGADYVVVGRKAALTAPWTELQAALARTTSAVWTRR